MTWTLPRGERRKCPPEYQEHVNRLGGLNRFGEPNFLLVWGQTHTDVIYGQMQDGKRGQHTVLMFHDIPAWHLLQWKPPELFGTAQAWYAMTWQPDDELHILGDYPIRGVYLPCPFNLYVKRVVGGTVQENPDGSKEISGERLEFDAMPLSFWLLDLLIPNILKERGKTYMEKQFTVRAQQEKQRQAWRNKVMDAYRDASPAFGGKDFDKSENRERMLAEMKSKRFPLTAEQVARRLGRGHVVR
jgi:hypothetical protein